jgi:hypothetical protein
MDFHLDALACRSRAGAEVTLTADSANFDYGERLAFVEEMLWSAREKKYSLFSNGELSQNA